MDETEIRNATENDNEAIADIYRSYLRTNVATIEQHELSTDTIRGEFYKVFASRAPFIVAVETASENLCGYAYTGPFNERSGYQFTC